MSLLPLCGIVVSYLRVLWGYRLGSHPSMERRLESMMSSGCRWVTLSLSIVT